MKIYFILPILAFTLSGCLMIGKQEFACQNGEDLKDAGICGSSMYILKNKNKIAEDSYRSFKKKEELTISVKMKKSVKKIKK